MGTKNATSLIGSIILVLTISLLMSGGCDIEFSTDNGNGGGGNSDSTLQGNVIDIIPDMDILGITVTVEDQDTNLTFEDMTDSSGFFRIEGRFSGSPSRVEFLDEDLALIAPTNVTIFPGARVDMGNITITNGNVATDIINTIFEANIIENNCSGDSGTLEVEVDNDIDVIVQVSSATDIILDNDDDLLCEDLLVDDHIEIDGELTGGDVVDADRIEVL